MCLTIKLSECYTSKHIIELDWFTKTADEDIKVYKIFYRPRFYAYKLVSPYQGTQWGVNGQEMIIEDFVSEIENPDEDYFVLINVHDGLHSYISKEYATTKAKKYNCRHKSRHIVLECIIPKGTKYIIGTKKDIVSLKLIIPKVPFWKRFF